MVQGSKKSGSKRKVFVKTPGARNVVHYRTRNPQKHKCGECGAELHGIPRLKNSLMKNLPKTLKRPERPFGGVLCTSCARKKIVAENRS